MQGWESDMVAEMKREREALREENARLRETIHAIGVDAERDHTMLDQAVALARIRSRVGYIQRGALAPQGEL